MPRLVAVTGGIASGKSAVSRWFERRGHALVDADRVAHGLYAPGTDLNGSIVAAFGPSVRGPEGAIDRKALGALVFADPAALARLDALVHPAARQELSRIVDRAEAEGSRTVLEMALLSRWPAMARRFDAVVGVSAPRDLRRDRLMERNGLSREEAESRLARQEPEEVLLGCATWTVVNDGTLEELERRLADQFR